MGLITGKSGGFREVGGLGLDDAAIASRSRGNKEGEEEEEEEESHIVL